MVNRDFIGVQEAHSTPGRARSFESEFVGKFRSLWAHMTKRKAGIGIIVSEQFLSKFQKDVSWEEVVPGRVGILRLRGSSGSLDLAVCYLDAGNPAERISACRRLSDSLRSSSEALSLAFGDFNFVEHATDRIEKSSGRWTGQSNEREATIFNESLLHPNELHEWPQNEHTCEMASCRSRIDRCYANMAISEQQDRHTECVALEWPYRLSTHRPIHFARVSHSRRQGKPALSERVLTSPDYPGRVERVFKESLRGRNSHGLAQLDLLKFAMRKAADEIYREKKERPAATTEERISASISLLRALQRRDAEQAQRMLKQYSHLSTIIEHADAIGALHPRNLQRLQAHIVELCNEDVQARMDELKAVRSQIGASQYESRKEHILKRMQKLLPGNVSSGVDAIIEHEGGQVFTEPEDIARRLTGHWQKVFSEKPVDRQRMTEWLSMCNDPIPFTGDPTEFVPTEQDIGKAIDEAHESAPGPDGLPFKAWKIVRKIALPILGKAAEQLTRLNQDQMEAMNPFFNEAFLTCLGKKAAFSQEGIGSVFAPDATRPLSVVNTDNRLMASAFRIKVSDIVEPWISPAQRGFIRGRSMLQNIIDIDEASMRVSLKHPRGAIVLFDFAAAFPSVSHAYLWEALRALGIPSGLLNAIQCFYVNNVHTIKVKGQKFPSITSRSGIRQGCPLSPLIFAVVADVLLRRLVAEFPECLVRAFADDTAMALTNFDTQAGAVMKMFREFGAISGLHLNMPKTVLVPLWRFNSSSFRIHLADSLPEWSATMVATWGKYLGYIIGPGKGSSTWTGSIAKYKARGEQWSTLPVGLFRGCQNYMTFVLSVLAFHLQLADVPDELYMHESAILRKFNSGPGTWFVNKDLFNLSTNYGFPMSYPSIRSVALAAKLRVIEFEAPDAQQRAGIILDEWMEGHFRPFPLEWYQSSHLAVLDRAAKQALELGVTARTVGLALAQQARHAADDRQAYTKKHFQRESYRQILMRGPDHQQPHERFRVKMKRWPSDYVARTQAERAQSLLSRLGGLVRPRVLAAVWRTLWNSWCTQRRFQKEARCKFGCSVDARDCIEHYAFCKVYERFRCSTLSLVKPRSLDDFFMLQHPAWTDDRVILEAVAVFALYTVFNMARQLPLDQQLPESYFVDAMERASYHAVQNHRRSSKALSVARLFLPNDQGQTGQRRQRARLMGAV